jgi:hypothetical protein
VKDDYLWDGSGEPDPEVAELERKLRPLRHRPRPLEAARKKRRRPIVWLAGGVLAAAAGVLLFVTAASQKRATPSAAPTADPSAPSFAVRRLEGAPAIGQTRAWAEARLHVGGWLETDAGSRADIQVADIGVVRVEPDTRVRLVGTGPSQHRLELARGRIAARVVAPPRLFVVDTPAATAVDLGCAYTMTVADDGSGRLHVTSGEVMLEGHGRTSNVVEGTIAETRRGLGPGTPYVEDAPEELRHALARLDFEKGGLAEARRVAALARLDDTITLEHLVARLEGEEREVVHQRLCALGACR